MRELSIFEINERRMIARTKRERRREGIEEGKREGIEQGAAQQRSILVRQAERRFGADVGRRLAARLGAVSDPVVFEKAGDLIVDCDDGEQLLDGINGTPPR